MKKKSHVGFLSSESTKHLMNELACWAKILLQLENKFVILADTKRYSWVTTKMTKS